jgi:hypothetical protein
MKAVAEFINALPVCRRLAGLERVPIRMAYVEISLLNLT